MNRENFEKIIFEYYGKTICFTEIEWQVFCKLKQADKVWWHLKQFGKITNKECHEIYGIRHCPSVIRDIRNNPFVYGDQHFFIEGIESKEPDRWGNKTHFVTYTLKQYT